MRGKQARKQTKAEKEEADAAAAQMQAVMRRRQATQVNSNYVLSEELKAEAERVFRVADRDGSNTIDLSELSSLRNSPEMAGKMMQAVDTSKSGSVDLTEWLAFITKEASKGAAGPKIAAKLLR